jgi:phosphopantothenate-cysteine ligase
MLVEGPDGSVRVRDQDSSKVLSVLKKYDEAKEKNMLLSLPFVTIDDYLHKLRALSHAMRPLGHDGLLYLAAAVSDFFLPVSLTPLA